MSILSVKKAARRSYAIAFTLAVMKGVAISIIANILKLKFIGFRYISLGVKMTGVSAIKIGKNTAIGSGTWLNVNNRRKNGYSIVIGDNCFIGRGNFFTSGYQIIVSDYCLITGCCSFLGSMHRYGDPLKPIIATGTDDGGTIRIGVNCFFGHGASVEKNVTIGHGSIIGAGAKVRKDVPPFSMVVGIDGAITKRYCFKRNQWVNWPDAELAEGPDENIYLDQLQSQQRNVFLPVAAAGGSLFSA